MSGTAGVAIATGIVIDLLNSTLVISQIIRQAQAEGRSNLTPQEWAVLDADRNKANARLDAAIENAEKNNPG